MKDARVWLAAGLAAMLALTGLAAGADEIGEAGRAILEQNRQTVVTVRLIVKMTFGGMGSEEGESEVTGTVIGPDGLTVVSLTATDPSTMLQQMFGDEDFQMSAQVTDVKILLEDGRELDAKIILRDKVLDLAFVRPVEKPAEPMATVSLTQAPEVQILDELVVLTRLGRVARREYAAAIERIEAIISKPRTFYVPGSDPSTADLGSPAFSADGAFVGIGVMRAIKSSGGRMMSMFGGGSGDNMMVIIVPASDIAESAEQVPAWGEEPEEVAPAPEAESEDAPADGEAPEEEPAQEQPAEL